MCLKTAATEHGKGSACEKTALILRLASSNSKSFRQSGVSQINRPFRKCSLALRANARAARLSSSGISPRKKNISLHVTVVASG